MICPNGTLSINQLKKIVLSDEYVVYFEPNDEPEGWDWKKNGIYHSPNRSLIETFDHLQLALEEEIDGKGRIIYDITPEYSLRHPYEGEDKTYIKEEFFWEYASQYGEKKRYKICECSYLGDAPKYVPLQLVQFDNGFESCSYQLGSWERDSEGYEFHFCGPRMFENICEEDLPIIWEALKKADEYLRDRFKTKED